MEIPAHILEHFAELIYKETGIVYNESNFFALEKRLNEITKSLEYGSVVELFEKVKGGIIANDLKSFILDTATNNETSFFRDRHVFLTLAAEVVKPLLDSHDGSYPLRVWSAAASTGQEIYTLGFCLEDLRAKEPGLDWQGLATDLSTKALARAKEGSYSQLEVQRGLPAPMLVKYFTRAEGSSAGIPGNWNIKPDLKNRIRFDLLNLTRSFPPGLGMFDIILLRNVLIYQDMENRVKILQNICKHLQPGGYLVLGSAERVADIQQYFDQTVVGKAVLYRKKLEAAKAS